MSSGPVHPEAANAPALINAQDDPVPNDEKPSEHGPDSEGYEEENEDEVQEGVRQMRAITQTWTKRSLTCAYILMWLIYFVRAFSGSVTGNLSAFVVSDFESHSLVPLIGVVSDVMSAALYMPIAKALNLFDRSYGFLFLAFMTLVGHIMSAACRNVETYAAAQVFTSVGLTGMILSIDVLTADTSHLKDRGLAYAYTSSPYIITTFAGAKIAEHFHETDWRWAFGIVCILIPVVALPMFALLQYNKRRAIREGALTVLSNQMSIGKAIRHYVVEFDCECESRTPLKSVLGIFLLAAGLALFLIPFNIAAEAPNGWASGYIIAMLVVGLVLMIAFGISQALVPKPVIPFRLLLSRSILGACLLDVTYMISSYTWSYYFTSFLQVNFDVSVSQAGYISGAWDIMSTTWLLGVGYLIRRTQHFRWILFVSIPIYLLGSGLLIHFRQPGMNVGYIVMCQVFLAIGGGACILCQQVAVLAASSHNNAAAALGILGVFGNIGGSVGSAISGAIWTHTLPKYLQEYLPEESLADWETIYDDLDVQLSYPVGDPTRLAIQYAYADTQRIMLIAGTCIMATSLAWTWLIRDTNLNKANKIKGTIF